MADPIKIELTTDEWGQVMIVLQGGIYRVVAPLLQKINNQLIAEMHKQQGAANIAANIAAGPRLVEAEQPQESAAE